MINKDVKRALLDTYQEIKKKYKTKHKGILALLQLFGDPETLLAEHSPPKPISREKEIPMISVD